jgi:aryl-alcohol dehydrogenase-like predicted oxidoreductase
MRYSKLGNTGLEVSNISFGASSLGGVFHDINEMHAIEAVQTALQVGINYIDVAPAYGATKAETVLGKALRNIPRSSYFISTKVGKNTAPGGYGVDTFDYSYDAIMRSIDESASRIGVDYFDIIYLHDIEYNNREHTEWALKEGIETLQYLKSIGSIGSVGLGFYPVDLWEQVIDEGIIDVGLTHNIYCLNDTRFLSLLAKAKEKNIGLINASPFASGSLTNRGSPDWHPSTKDQRAIFTKVAEHCSRCGSDISKLAIQFSTQNKDIVSTMFSSANPTAVNQNIQWSNEPVDNKLLQEVLDILAPISNQNWNY